MELCKYNEYRLYAYKNIKLPDASSRKYRKICLMACIYAYFVKIYTMYLWDTRGYTLENIYRVDQSPRLKNELLPAVSER